MLGRDGACGRALKVKHTLSCWQHTWIPDFWTFAAPNESVCVGHPRLHRTGFFERYISLILIKMSQIIFIVFVLYFHFSKLGSLSGSPSLLGSLLIATLPCLTLFCVLHSWGKPCTYGIVGCTAWLQDTHQLTVSVSAWSQSHVCCLSAKEKWSCHSMVSSRLQSLESHVSHIQWYTNSSLLQIFSVTHCKSWHILITNWTA